MEAQEALRMAGREVAATLEQVDPGAVETLVGEIAAARQVFVTGQGRSGAVVRAFAVRLAQLGLDAHLVGEPTTGAIGPRDLLVVASGSGETPGSITAACAAQQAGARVALVTVAPESTIGGMAELKVRIPAPSPKAAPSAVVSVQPMGTLFEQALLVVLDVVVLLLMARLGETSQSMFARHTNLE